MRLRHEFTVPVSAGEAWPVLGDLGRIAPCLPGVTLTAATPREVEGKVRVRVGPITVTYRGSARVTELDERDHRAVITARGKEARGDGRMRATITARLHDVTGGARVTVATDLTVTGRLGQAGRDALDEAGGRMLDRFAGQVAELLAGAGAGRGPAVPVGEAEPAGETGRTSPPAGADADRPVPDPTPAPVPGAVPGPASGPVAARPARVGTPMASFADRSVDPPGSRAPALRRVLSVLGLVLLALLIRARRRRRRR